MRRMNSRWWGVPGRTIGCTGNDKCANKNRSDKQSLSLNKYSNCNWDKDIKVIKSTWCWVRNAPDQDHVISFTKSISVARQSGECAM